MVAESVVTTDSRGVDGHVVTRLDEIPTVWPFAAGPVVVAEAVPHWPVHELVGRERLVDEYGGVLLDVGTCAGDVRRSMSLADFLAYCASVPDAEELLYAKRWAVSAELDRFASVPLPPALCSWFASLPERTRPDWNWMFIGPRGSRSPLHGDTMCSSAWNLLVSGRKRWRILSPAASVAADRLRPELLELVEDHSKYELTYCQQPGDLLLVPSCWAHEVVNEEPSIALTGNFINQDNHTAVEKYLATAGHESWLKVIRRLSEAYGRRCGSVGS